MTLIRFIIAAAKRSFVWAALAGVASGLTVVGLLSLTNEALNNPSLITPFYATVFFATTIVMVVLRVQSIILLEKLSQTSIAALRMQLSRQVLAAPLASLEQKGSHKLIASLSTDIAMIAMGIMRLPFLLTYIAILAGCLAYMLWLSWWMFLILLSAMAIGVFIYRLPQTRALSLYKLARADNDELYKHFEAICKGTKELKMNAERRRRFISESLQTVLYRYSQHMLGGTTYYAYAGGFGLMMFFLAIGIVLFIIPAFVAIEPATLIGYVIILLFIQGPMEGVINSIPELAKTSVSLKKIEALGFDLNEAIEEENVFDSGNTQPLAYQQCLELKNIVHSYYREPEDSHFELGPIDLSFTPGELVFIIGGNGSGKTTLAKIILGLYRPQSGSIFVDGEEILLDQYDAYRQLFSVVFADFFLFEELIGESTGDLDQQAQYYLEHLQLAHKVKITDGKLSTLNLSQGQRKRLTLVAAYLEDRPIYVFDEWAADQDPEFKHIFYTEILPDLKERGKTVLVISHDEKYFHLADRCIKIDAGKIIDSSLIDSSLIDSQD